MVSEQYNFYLVSNTHPWFCVLERKVLVLQFTHLPIKTLVFFMVSILSSL